MNQRSVISTVQQPPPKSANQHLVQGRVDDERLATVPMVKARHHIQDKNQATRQGNAIFGPRIKRIALKFVSVPFVHNTEQLENNWIVCRCNITSSISLQSPQVAGTG